MIESESLFLTDGSRRAQKKLFSLRRGPTPPIVPDHLSNHLGCDGNVMEKWFQKWWESDWKVMEKRLESYWNSCEKVLENLWKVIG